jgi:hypothetical protein
MKSNIKLSKFLTASSIAITPGTTTPAKSAPFNDQFFHADGAVNGTVQRLITLPDGDGTFAASALSFTSFSPASRIGWKDQVHAPISKPEGAVMRPLSSSEWHRISRHLAAAGVGSPWEKTRSPGGEEVRGG